MRDGMNETGSHCLMCGCDRDDHYEPDPYDMGNAELDASGHLNHCGDCAQCFGPEYQKGGEDTMTTEVDQLVNAMRRLRGVALRYDRWAEQIPVLSRAARAEGERLRAELEAAVKAVPACPVCGDDWVPGPCPGCGLA